MSDPDDHGRYDYSPIIDRPVYVWPGGKRLALYVALNVEHFPFGRGMGHSPTPAAPPPDHRNYAWRDYGLRVGIWRIFDLLDQLKLPACHLTNSDIFARYPQIVDRMRQRGDEIIGHGRTNAERQGDMAEAEEAALIREATDAVTQAWGTRPRGWMGPWISETRVTPDLLKEAGYDFVMDWPCDDQPIWMRTRSGPLLHVPYPVEINDSPAMLIRHHTASDFTQMIKDQFDTMLELSAAQPLICTISLHTFVVGQPFRFAQLKKALEYVTRPEVRDRVWYCRPGEIADHVMALPKGTVPGS